MKISVLCLWGGVVFYSLVLGTFILQMFDLQSYLVVLGGFVPFYVPSVIEIGIVENKVNNKIYPFKAAKLNSQNNNLSLRWYIEFWAWSKSENKLKRKRLTTINNLKSIEERNIFAFHTINEINKLLESGYYFDSLQLEKNKAIESKNKIKEHIPVNEFLFKCLFSNKNKYNGRTFLDKKSDVTKFNNWIVENNLIHLSIVDLQVSHCVDYQKYLIGLGLAGKTINCNVATIKTLYNELIFEGVIKDNPFSNLKRIKEVKTSQNKAYSDIQLKEIKEILIKNDKQIYIFCLFMFYCFVRPNEIRQLKIKYLDLNAKKLFIPAEISKNKINFTIDVPLPLIELLKVYLSENYNQDFYIFSALGVPSFKMYGRNSVRDKYKLLVKGLNLGSEYSLYSWKHSGVVKAYKSGIDLKALQIQGRWHSIEMVDNYLKSLGLIENKNFTSIMNFIDI